MDTTTTYYSEYELEELRRKYGRNSRSYYEYMLELATKAGDDNLIDAFTALRDNTPERDTRFDEYTIRIRENWFTIQDRLTHSDLGQLFRAYLEQSIYDLDWEGWKEEELLGIDRLMGDVKTYQEHTSKG